MTGIGVSQKREPTVKVEVAQPLECSLIVRMDTGLWTLLRLGQRVKVAQHALLDMLAQGGQGDVPRRHSHQCQLCLHGNCSLGDRH